METTREATMHMVHVTWDSGSYQEHDGPQAAVTILVQKSPQTGTTTLHTVKATTLAAAWSQTYDAVRKLVLLEVSRIMLDIARHNSAGKTVEAARQRDRFGRICDELNGHAELDRRAAGAAAEGART